MHKGAETNFRQKIDSHQDLPAKDIKEAAAANFDGQVSRGYLLNSDEKAVGATKILGQAKDSTIKLVDVYASDVAPEIQPELVEKRQYLQLPCEYDLLSIIDVATVDSEIIDLKTASKKKVQSEADDSDQLSWQAMAYRNLSGKFPKSLRLEVVIDTGKNTNHQSLLTLRGEKDTEVLLNKINSMIAGVKAGIFLPAEPGSWLCNQKWCGYWPDCPYVNQERRNAAERSL